MELQITKVSLTSLEIAELTGKEHRSITRDIEVQLGELEGGVHKFEHTYEHPQNGQVYKMYILPKRELLILVSGYSVKLRAAIIDRLEYLESQNLTCKETPYFLKEVDLTDKKVRKAFFKAFDGKCYYTQKPLTFDAFHIDHILPRSRGGQDVLMNLVVCDPAVNSGKLNAYDEAFVTKHQEIVKHNQALKVMAYLTTPEMPKVSSKDIGALLNPRTMEKVETMFGVALAREFYGDILGIEYEKIDKQFLTSSENVKNFVDEMVTLSNDTVTQTTVVFEKYRKWCIDNEIIPATRIPFAKRLKQLTGLDNYQKRIDGERVRVLNLEIGA